jgi:hypothetical protein
MSGQYAEVSTAKDVSDAIGEIFCLQRFASLSFPFFTSPFRYLSFNRSGRIAVLVGIAVLLDPPVPTILR